MGYLHIEKSWSHSWITFCCLKCYSLLNNLTLSSLSDISSAAMYVAFETHFQSFKSFWPFQHCLLNKTSTSSSLISNLQPNKEWKNRHKVYHSQQKRCNFLKSVQVIARLYIFPIFSIYRNICTVTITWTDFARNSTTEYHQAT